jgi:TPR repeat protein
MLCGTGVPACPCGSLEAGVVALGHGDYERALEIFTPLAHIGNQSAQSFLAHTYTLLEDYEQAYAWYFASAECGSADASVDLAILSEKVSEEQIARGKSLGRSFLERYCLKK